MILDTNALSAMADGEPEFAAAAADVGRFALPVVVLAEFRFGILRSRHRRRYEAWLEDLMEASLILPVDEETSVRYAAIREALRVKGRPIPSNDAWIAALAVQHRLAVMSRDPHFDELDGVKRQSW